MLNKEKKTKELLSYIAKLEKKYEDKIAVVIISALRKSEKIIDISGLIAIWDEAANKIIDLIITLLILINDRNNETINLEDEKLNQSLKNYLKEIGTLLIQKNRKYGNAALNPCRIYPKAKIPNRIDIKSLTWQKDGKTIEDRVRLYCAYACEVLKVNKNISNLRDRLIHDFIRIIETEDIVILNQVLRKRVAEYYPYVQFSNGSCECCGPREIELVKNVSEWPPFHPMCKCVVILLTEEEYNKK